MEGGIRAFRYWENGLHKKVDTGSSETVEGSKHKLFNRTLIIYHSRMKTEKCECHIPTNNNENIGQIIKITFGRFLASKYMNNSKIFLSLIIKTPILKAIKKITLPVAPIRI